MDKWGSRDQGSPDCLPAARPGSGLFPLLSQCRQEQSQLPVLSVTSPPFIWGVAPSSPFPLADSSPEYHTAYLRPMCGRR